MLRNLRSHRNLSGGGGRVLGGNWSFRGPTHPHKTLPHPAIPCPLPRPHPIPRMPTAITSTSPPPSHSAHAHRHPMPPIPAARARLPPAYPRAPPHTRLPARPPPAIANLVGASRWRTASRQFSSTVMPPSQLLLTVPFSQLLSTLPFLQLLSTLSVLLSAMHVLQLLTTAGHTTAGCRLQALLR